MPEGYKVKYKVVDNGDNTFTATVTNTHDVTRDIEVKKDWDDSNDKEGKRPTEIAISLLANDVVKQTIVLSADNEWKGTFTKLPMYDEDGDEIKYSVKELKIPDNYNASYSGDVKNGFTVKNTYVEEQEELRDIEVTKTWKDHNNKDGVRPKSITVRLKADGKEVAMVKITAADGWKHTFTDWPVYNKDGKKIVYTVTEDAVSGYRTTVSGYDITNTRSRGPRTGDDSDLYRLMLLTILSGTALLSSGAMMYRNQRSKKRR